MEAPQPENAAVQPSKPAEWFEQNPHAKISFSRLAVYRRCPAWYRYQYLDWHKVGSPAVTRAGHAVQEAFEETIEWVPSTGLDARGLLEQAQAQGFEFFKPVWEREREGHETEPNSIGPWNLDRDRYAGYLANALQLHTYEVVQRSHCRHPRTGSTLDLEPLSDLSHAWQEAKPLHPPPGIPLGGMETVPGGFFQGEFDLVYDWTGARRIVDLKASDGTSPFSGEIDLQLKAYAWLERSLGRGTPEGLEAWFLGAAEPKLFEVPDAAALDAFESEVLALLDRSAYLKGFGEWSPDQFPIAPAPVEGHEPESGDPSAWCRFCPNSRACPKSSAAPPSASPGCSFQELPHSGRVSIYGYVAGVGQPTNKRGKTTRRFTITNDSGVRSFTWETSAIDPLIAQGLRAGNTVLIENLNPWRHPKSGDVLLYPTQSMRLTVTP